MIRTIITLEDEELRLSLPADFVGKQVEILAFVIEEPKAEATASQAKTFSALQIDTQGFRFNRDEANAR